MGLKAFRLVLAGCALTALIACSARNPAPQISASASRSPSQAPPPAASALFYAKAGRILVSDNADRPGSAITQGGRDDEPAPSPDRKQVAFVRRPATTDPSASEGEGGDLWVVRRDGSNAHRLVDPASVPETIEGRVASQPIWSPAGDKIAFVVPSEGGGALKIADANSGAITPTSLPEGASAIAWSPDGTQLAWNSARSDVGPHQVGVVEASSGSSKTLLTGTNASSVDWTPDGTSILFTNQFVSPDLGDSIPFTLKTGGVYSIATTGGAPKAITIDTGTDFLDDVAGLKGQIAFTTQPQSFGSDPPQKVLKTIDTAGGAANVVFDNVAPEAPGPRWSRDDRAALIAAGSEKSLTVISPSTGIEQPVDTGVTSFAWVPPVAALSTATNPIV